MAESDIVARFAGTADEEIVGRVRQGENPLYEVLMRRYNQRLYRTVRSIVRDDLEAEDIVQETHVRAWSSLGQFRGECSFSTWLTRIAVHEAIARAKRRKRLFSLSVVSETCSGEARIMAARTSSPRDVELARALSRAIDDLPQRYRTVFVLRDVEGLTTTATAAALQLSEINVRVRLSRARAFMRRSLRGHGIENKDVFAFLGNRCDRLVQRVFQTICKNIVNGAFAV